MVDNQFEQLRPIEVPRSGDNFRAGISNQDMRSWQAIQTRTRPVNEISGAEEKMFGNGLALNTSELYAKKDVLIANNPVDSAAKHVRDSFYFNVEHPGRKNPDAKVDYPGAKAAYERFELGKYGVDKALVPALIRNEQNWLKFKDAYIQDPLVEDGDIPKLENWTIGPAQMKVQTIESLVGKYPEQFTELSRPAVQATELGGMTVAERDESLAQKALEPRYAALLVGAYIADKIDRLGHGHAACPDRPPAENEQIGRLWQSGDAEKRTEALIRTYNPHDKLHLKNVLKQMQQVHQLHEQAL